MVFLLLVAFQIKHFLADYPFQTPYMLGKFKQSGWVRPLAYHCWVHAGGTLLITQLAGASSGVVLLSMAIDFVAHFIMDRVKASPKLLGRFKALSAKEFPNATEADKDGNRKFWYSLGIDQMVHHLTHYAIIYMILELS